MKMIKTSFGYMSKVEAKIIGDLARDERKSDNKKNYK